MTKWCLLIGKRIRVCTAHQNSEGFQILETASTDVLNCCLIDAIDMANCDDFSKEWAENAMNVIYIELTRRAV